MGVLHIRFKGFKIIQWESNAEVTHIGTYIIGYNILGLGLVSLWWFKDHLELSGWRKQ